MTNIKKHKRSRSIVSLLLACSMLTSTFIVDGQFVFGIGGIYEATIVNDAEGHGHLEFITEGISDGEEDDVVSDSEADSESDFDTPDIDLDGAIDLSETGLYDVDPTQVTTIEIDSDGNVINSSDITGDISIDIGTEIEEPDETEEIDGIELTNGNILLFDDLIVDTEGDVNAVIVDGIEDFDIDPYVVDSQSLDSDNETEFLIEQPDDDSSVGVSGNVIVGNDDDYSDDFTEEYADDDFDDPAGFDVDVDFDFDYSEDDESDESVEPEVDSDIDGDIEEIEEIEEVEEDDPISEEIRSFMSGNTIIIRAVPDDGYFLNTVKITTSNGKSVAYSITDGQYIAFRMPNKSVRITAKFSDVKSKIDTNKDTVDTQTYILSNLNYNYIGEVDKWVAINAMHTTQTMAVRDVFYEAGRSVTIRDMYPVGDAGLDILDAAFVNQVENVVSIFDVSEDSDYYVAYVDMLNDPDTEISDFSFTRNNAFGELLEGCIIDTDTGIAYIPKGYVVDISNDDDFTEGDYCPIQTQLLTTYATWSDDIETNINVFISNNDKTVDGVLSLDIYDAYVGFVVPDTIGDVSDKDIMVNVNGAWISDELYVWDYDSFSLSIELNPISCDTISVNFVDRTFDVADSLLNEQLSVSGRTNLSSLPLNSVAYTSQAWRITDDNNGASLVRGDYYTFVHEDTTLNTSVVAGGLMSLNSNVQNGNGNGYYDAWPKPDGAVQTGNVANNLSTPFGKWAPYHSYFFSRGFYSVSENSQLINFISNVNTTPAEWDETLYDKGDSYSATHYVAIPRNREFQFLSTGGKKSAKAIINTHASAYEVFIAHCASHSETVFQNSGLSSGVLKNTNKNKNIARIRVIKNIKNDSSSGTIVFAVSTAEFGYQLGTGVFYAQYSTVRKQGKITVDKFISKDKISNTSNLLTHKDVFNAFSPSAQTPDSVYKQYPYAYGYGDVSKTATTFGLYASDKKTKLGEFTVIGSAGNAGYKTCNGSTVTSTGTSTYHASSNGSGTITIDTGTYYLKEERVGSSSMQMTSGWSSKVVVYEGKTTDVNASEAFNTNKINTASLRIQKTPIPSKRDDSLVGTTFNVYMTAYDYSSKWTTLAGKYDAVKFTTSSTGDITCSNAGGYTDPAVLIAKMKLETDSVITRVQKDSLTKRTYSNGVSYSPGYDTSREYLTGLPVNAWYFITESAHADGFEPSGQIVAIYINSSGKVSETFIYNSSDAFNDTTMGTAQSGNNQYSSQIKHGGSNVITSGNTVVGPDKSMGGQTYFENKITSAIDNAALTVVNNESSGRPALYVRKIYDANKGQGDYKNWEPLPDVRFYAVTSKDAATAFMDAYDRGIYYNYNNNKFYIAIDNSAADGHVIYAEATVSPSAVSGVSTITYEDKYGEEKKIPSKYPDYLRTATILRTNSDGYAYYFDENQNNIGANENEKYGRISERTSLQKANLETKHDYYFIEAPQKEQTWLDSSILNPEGYELQIPIDYYHAKTGVGNVIGTIDNDSKTLTVDGITSIPNSYNGNLGVALGIMKHGVTADNTEVLVEGIRFALFYDKSVAMDFAARDGWNQYYLINMADGMSGLAQFRYPASAVTGRDGIARFDRWNIFHVSDPDKIVITGLKLQDYYVVELKTQDEISVYDKDTGAFIEGPIQYATYFNTRRSQAASVDGRGDGSTPHHYEASENETVYEYPASTLSRYTYTTENIDDISNRQFSLDDYYVPTDESKVAHNYRPGKLVIEKIDDKGKPVSGIRFLVVNQDGNNDYKIAPSRNPAAPVEGERVPADPAFALYLQSLYNSNVNNIDNFVSKLTMYLNGNRDSGYTNNEGTYDVASHIYTTNSDGIIEFEAVTNGATYLVLELPSAMQKSSLCGDPYYIDFDAEFKLYTAKISGTTYVSNLAKTDSDYPSFRNDRKKWFKLYKKSTEKENPLIDYRDITYGLYTDEACTKLYKNTTITVDAKTGESTPILLDNNKIYYIKEISADKTSGSHMANPYYLLSDTVFAISTKNGDTKVIKAGDGKSKITYDAKTYTFTLTAFDIPADDPIKITIRKTDDENNIIHTISDDYDLEGTEFEILYYHDYINDASKLSNYTRISREVVRAVKETDSKGNAIYTISLTNRYEPGTIAIRETKSMPAYLNSGSMFVYTDEKGSMIEDEEAGSVVTNSSSYQRIIGDANTQIPLFHIKPDEDRPGYAYTTLVNANTLSDKFDYVDGGLVVSYHPYGDTTNDADEDDEDIATNLSVLMQNEPIRGDIVFYKTNRTGSSVNATFRIYLMNGTGEDAEVVEYHDCETINGVFRSEDAPKEFWFYGTTDENNIDPTTEDLKRGRLIKGHYRLVETSNDGGYQLIDPIEFDITDDNMYIDLQLGTFKNYEYPVITTTEKDATTNSHFSYDNGKASITDDITVKYLHHGTAGDKYCLFGVLVEVSDPSNPKIVTDTSGNAVTAVKHFDLSKISLETYEQYAYVYNTTVTFNFDYEIGSVKKFVVFEYLFNYDENMTAFVNHGTADGFKVGEHTTSTGFDVSTEDVAMYGLDVVFSKDVYMSRFVDENNDHVSHADIYSETQTGYMPILKTSAIDMETGMRMAHRDSQVQIRDTVSIMGLLIGGEYQLRATLYDKATGGQLLAATTEVEFEAGAYSENHDVNLSFNASDFANTEVVVYEELWYKHNGKWEKAAEHKDINDLKQTITIPDVSTTALAADTEKHITEANSKVTINDKVKIRGLYVDEEFTVTGVLHYSDGSLVPSSVGKVKNSVTFTASKTSNESITYDAKENCWYVTVSFDIDASKLGGKTIVCYESLSYKGLIVAEHEDPNDYDQSVDLPTAGTTATNTKNDTKFLLSEKNASVTDVVHYENFNTNYNYYIVAELRDLSTTSRDIIKEVKVDFKPSAKNGDKTVTIPVDLTNYAGHKLVVFEYIYLVPDSGTQDRAKDIVVARHTDIDDLGQTVYVLDLDTYATHYRDDVATKEIWARGMATVVDDLNVSPTGYAGEVFTAMGYLVDRETEEVVTTGYLTWKTTSTNSSTQMIFAEFNAQDEKYLNRDLVAYEYIYVGDVNRAGLYNPTVGSTFSRTAVENNSFYPDCVAIHADRDDPDQTVRVIGAQVYFTKTTMNGQKLSNARLKVIDLNTGEVMADWDSKDDDNAHMIVLSPSKYRLIEYKAAPGYVVIDPIDFEVVVEKGPDGKNIGKTYYLNSDGTRGSEIEKDADGTYSGRYHMYVKDAQLVSLPSAGGMGTIRIISTGMIISSISMILYNRKKKRDEYYEM